MNGLRAFRVVLLLFLVTLFEPFYIFSAEVHVTNLSDSGSGSLREAITSAQSGDQIVFDAAGIIKLTSGELVLNKDVDILGPGPSNLTISGNNQSRVLRIASNVVVRISGVTISNGAATDGFTGGGIRNSGTVNMDNCAISNSSQTGFANFGSAKLTDCIITENKSFATLGVGGIQNEGALTLIRARISANAGFAGGGLDNSGVMTIAESSILDNTTSHSGGGFINGGTLTIERSTISGNAASNTAGAFYNVGAGSLTLTNSTVAGNRANFGGGAIRNQNPTSRIALIHTTLVGNDGLFGGVIQNTGTIIVKNSLVSSHSVGANCVGTGIVSRGYNISSDASCANYFNQPGDLNSIDPFVDFAGLKDNGGRTKTVALLAGSPAINSIPPNACIDLNGSPLSTDQRGVSRPQGVGCDIGAYEFVPPVLVVAIDIKPGDAKNTVSGRSNAAVPVAILSAAATASSAAFDATTVNPATVTLAGAAPVTPGANGNGGGNGRGAGNGSAGPLAQTADVNGDGRLDLLLHFRASDLKLPAAAPDGTVEAVLYGETWSGDAIRGTDKITIIK